MKFFLLSLKKISFALLLLYKSKLDYVKPWIAVNNALQHASPYSLLSIIRAMNMLQLRQNMKAKCYNHKIISCERYKLKTYIPSAHPSWLWIPWHQDPFPFFWQPFLSQLKQNNWTETIFFYSTSICFECKCIESHLMTVAENETYKQLFTKNNNFL